MPHHVTEGEDTGQKGAMLPGSPAGGSPARRCCSVPSDPHGPRHAGVLRVGI